MVKLIVAGQEYNLDQHTQGLMGYINEIQAIDKKDQIVIEVIPKEVFEKLLEASKIVGGKFNQVKKIKSQNSEQYIGKDLNEFFKGQSLNDLNAMYKAAEFLQMNGLKSNIVAFLSCKVFIQQNYESYENKKKQLGVKRQLTTQLTQAYKARCNFLS